MGKVAEKILPISNEQWNMINPFNKKITDEYLKNSPHLSPESLKQYRSALGIFFWWIYENAENKSIVDTKSKDYLRYQNYLINRDLSPNAIKLKRSVVSTLNQYIETYYEDEYPSFRNFINKNIAAPPPSFVHEKQPMNDIEWSKLIKELERMDEWQKIAYLMFSYSSGCRRSEAVQLEKNVVNSQLIIKEIIRKNKQNEDETITAKYYVTHDIRCKGRGKTGKVRKLQFDENAMKAIESWLSIRGDDDCPYVFVNKTKKGTNQLSVSSLNNWCSGLFSNIVGRRIHPHQIREKKATDLTTIEGKDIRVAQRLLGHNNSSTTEIYVIRDDSDDLAEAFI